MTRYTPKQRELLRIWQNGQLKRINLLEGSVSSGKTWVSLVLWAFWVATMPRDKLYLMCAKSLTTLKRNCLLLLQELVGENNFTFSIPAKEGYLFGRHVLFEGANDARAESKIRGMTLQGAYCDELTQFPEDFFAMLLSRLRVPGAKLIATTNPDNPNHWLMQNYIVRADELDFLDLKFTIDDNTELPEEYVENIKKEYTGVFYSRFILGEWVRAEGVIYPLFADNPSRYAISRDDLPKKKMNGKESEKYDFQYLTIGVDFGGNKSAYAFVATGITNDWEPLALRSIRIPAKGVSVEQMISRFVRFCEGVEADYSEIDYVYADCAEQAIINSMYQQTPYNVVGSIKGEIIDRIRTMDILLSTDRFKYVDGECDSLVKALCDAVWDDNKLEDVRLDDGTSDIDTLDAWEYSWSAFIKQILRG